VSFEGMDFETRAVHVGSEPDPATGAVIAPIYQTSTFAQAAVGEHKGYEYARTGNPTRTNLEACLASLEGVGPEGPGGGVCFASGMAATATVLQTLGPGDHLVLSADVYGGTYRVAARLFEGWGLRLSVVDMTSLDQLKQAIRSETRLVWVETPTNPLLGVVDIAGAAELAHAAGALCAVDNTFATPFLQRPLDLGADLVVHSSTKYLGGHSDVVGGALVTRLPELYERARFLQNAVGAVPGPWDCWLALRGIKTLPLRMQRHQENAGELARWLAAQVGAKGPRVVYPGLPDHPGHALARQQMGGFGGIVSLVFPDLESGKRFAEGLRLFTLAESLGGVESLVTHPASMTHASVPKAQREATGFTDGLVRLSVGCEDVEDLRADLARALAGVAAAAPAAR
jgi:cystathionine beta-lyase/cystathionine gamma-synthase